MECAPGEANADMLPCSGDIAECSDDTHRRVDAKKKEKYVLKMPKAPLFQLLGLPEATHSSSAIKGQRPRVISWSHRVVVRCWRVGSDL